MRKTKCLIIKNRKYFPKCVRHFKELKGICVGRCIDKADRLHYKHAAHAHCTHSRYSGWICLRRKSQLREKFTLLHEVAHIISGISNKVPHHGKKWREVVVSIGGTYESYLSYTKRYRYKDYTPKKRNKK